MTNHPNDPDDMVDMVDLTPDATLYDKYTDPEGPGLDPPEWAKDAGKIEPRPKKHKQPVPEVERVLADRSTLENYAHCPAMGRLIESGEVATSTNATESGQLAHEAISRTIQDYIESNGNANTKDDLVNWLRSSRPDLQPDVLSAVMPSAWAIADELRSTSPENILAFDGGEEFTPSRSSQFAWDMTSLPIRITSELDLVRATASPEVLRVDDWKTGWSPWTYEKVEHSFQFQLHAVLCFIKYPEITAVDISIWTTRLRKRTPAVRFARERMPDLTSRIASAAGVWYEHRNHAIDQCPTWPTIEKCEICSAATRCPCRPADADDDPEAMVDRLVALDAKRATIAKSLSAVVDKQGHDIETAAGNRFGRDYPKADRKRSAKTYQQKKEK